MRLMIAALALANTSCRQMTSGEITERTYNIAERNGDDTSQLCERARRVAEAYLNDGNEEQYKFWGLKSATKCLNAELNRRRP
jgi:tryptophanase